MRIHRAVGLLLVFVISIRAQRAPQTVPEASEGGKDREVRSLEAAGRKLVELLKNGNPQDLPALCWRNGVTVDLDGTTVSPKALGRMIAKKDWFYCAYFDSACSGRRKEQSKRTYSYRDLLLKATHVGLHASTGMRGERKRGVVTLQIDGGPAKEQLEEQEYNFIYVLEAIEWRITCFECDLTTRADHIWAVFVNQAYGLLPCCPSFAHNRPATRGRITSDCARNWALPINSLELR